MTRGIDKLEVSASYDWISEMQISQQFFTEVSIIRTLKIPKVQFLKRGKIRSYFMQKFLQNWLKFFHLNVSGKAALLLLNQISFAFLWKRSKSIFQDIPFNVNWWKLHWWAMSSFYRQSVQKHFRGNITTSNKRQIWKVSNYTYISRYKILNLPGESRYKIKIKVVKSAQCNRSM